MTIGGLCVLTHNLATDKEVDILLALRHEETQHIIVGELQRRHLNGGSDVIIVGHLPLNIQGFLT